MWQWNIFAKWWRWSHKTWQLLWVKVNALNRWLLSKFYKEFSKSNISNPFFYSQSSGGGHTLITERPVWCYMVQSNSHATNITFVKLIWSYKGYFKVSACLSYIILSLKVQELLTNYSDSGINRRLCLSSFIHPVQYLFQVRAHLLMRLSQTRCHGSAGDLICLTDPEFSSFSWCQDFTSLCLRAPFLFYLIYNRAESLFLFLLHESMFYCLNVGFYSFFFLFSLPSV